MLHSVYPSLYFHSNSDSKSTIKEESDDGLPKPTTLSLHVALLYFIIAFLLLIQVLLITLMPMSTKQSHFGSYETGFQTEMRPSQSTLTLHRVKFYGGVLFDENGTVSLSHRPGEPDYFGTPGPDIDYAWGKLLNARMIKVEPKDYPEGAARLSKQDLDPRLEHHTDPLTYRVETSGLHALHCLNYIRKSFWPEYYKGFEDPPEHEKDPKKLVHSAHLKHCLQQLQQALICQADLTPTPRTWRPAPAGKKGHGLFHADVDQWHTCRNWEAMREWMYPLQEYHL